MTSNHTLDPAHDGRVDKAEAARGFPLGQITKAQREVQAHAQGDNRFVTWILNEIASKVAC